MLPGPESLFVQRNRFFVLSPHRPSSSARGCSSHLVSLLSVLDSTAYQLKHSYTMLGLNLFPALLLGLAFLHSTSAQTCSQYGNSTSTGCLCPPGFNSPISNNDCSLPVCGGSLYSPGSPAPGGDGGNGNITLGTDGCACAAGWRGPACTGELNPLENVAHQSLHHSPILSELVEPVPQHHHPSRSQQLNDMFKHSHHVFFLSNDLQCRYSARPNVVPWIYNIDNHTNSRCCPYSRRRRHTHQCRSDWWSRRSPRSAMV